MRNTSSVMKREFLRKWMKGLGKCRMLKNNNMSFLERKKAIKLSADLAMASTRTPATRWSRAVIAQAASSQDDDNGYNKILINHVVGSPPANQKSPKGKVFIGTTSSSSSGLCRSIRILKRRRMVRRVVKKKEVKKIASPKVMAKRLVKKRTRMLKSLLPGGESMEDDAVLIEETLDYIQSLTAQVEVMRCLAFASDLIANS